MTYATSPTLVETRERPEGLGAARRYCPRGRTPGRRASPAHAISARAGADPSPWRPAPAGLPPFACTTRSRAGTVPGGLAAAETAPRRPVGAAERLPGRRGRRLSCDLQAPPVFCKTSHGRRCCRGGTDRTTHVLPPGLDNPTPSPSKIQNLQFAYELEVSVPESSDPPPVTSQNAGVPPDGQATGGATREATSRATGEATSRATGEATRPVHVPAGAGTPAWRDTGGCRLGTVPVIVRGGVRRVGPSTQAEAINPVTGALSTGPGVTRTASRHAGVPGCRRPSPRPGAVTGMRGSFHHRGDVRPAG